MALRGGCDRSVWVRRFTGEGGGGGVPSFECSRMAFLGVLLLCEGLSTEVPPLRSGNLVAWILGGFLLTVVEQMYSILNMSSITTEPDDGALTDDRTTKARIRDAAIDCFAENGIAGTTARRVAEAAGVSPGLVIHHFGSMDGLRSACDTYIASVIRQQKQETIMAGGNFDVMAAIRTSKIKPLAGYMARVLVDDSPGVAKLVDDLVADAEDYMQQGVEAGTLRPTAYPKARAVVFSMWSLGALVMRRHMNRLLGVDLADIDNSPDPALAEYLGSVYEILGNGIVSESVAAELQARVAGISGEDKPGPPASTG